MPPKETFEKASEETALEVRIDLKHHPGYKLSVDEAGGESVSDVVFYVTKRWGKNQKLDHPGLEIPLLCKDFEVLAQHIEKTYAVTILRDKIYRRYYRNHYHVRHGRKRQVDKACYLKWWRAKQNHENPIAYGQIMRWKRKLRRDSVCRYLWGIEGSCNYSGQCDSLDDCVKEARECDCEYTEILVAERDPDRIFPDYDFVRVDVETGKVISKLALKRESE